MKLDLTRWREALVRFEAELKHLKKQRRQPREPGESFDYAPLMLAKAEVTRLYCLRRHLKGKLHATGHLWCVRLGLSGRAYAQGHATTDLATQEALVRSVDGWMESFLEEQVVDQPAAPTTG